MEHLPIGLHRILVGVSGAIGMNLVITAFLILLILNLFVALLFKQVRNPSLRSFISLFVGLTWCALLYNVQNTMMLVAISTIVYFITSTGFMAPAKFAMLAIAILSGFHIYRMMIDYMGWTLDVTGPLMLFTAKFTTFAFDVYDGSRSNRGEVLSTESHVSVAREKTCLTTVPSLFEFYVFIFDFLGVLAGPVFHIREYLDFINLRGEFVSMHISFFRVVIDRFSSALVLGAVFAVAGTIPGLSVEYLVSVDHKAHPFVVRIFTVHIITLLSRMRYYFAWYMAETACLIAGIGYNPSNRDKFSRSQNAIISKVDWANCQSEAVSHWNISISKWLRGCIYLRAHESPIPSFLAGKIGHRQYATLLTRFTSAFWHGFYPGYYLCFFSTVLQFEADSIARKFIRPLFTKTGSTTPHWIYTLAGKIHTAVCLNYYGSAFVVLSATTAFDIWTDLYFSVHILNIATIVLVPVVCKTLFRSKYSKHEKKTE